MKSLWRGVGFLGPCGCALGNVKKREIGVVTVTRSGGRRPRVEALEPRLYLSGASGPDDPAQAAKAILDEKRLAKLLHVTHRTVRRMVQRFELPPPTRLAGRSVWIAGRVLAHIEAAAERAERDARRHAQRNRQRVP